MGLNEPKRFIVFSGLPGTGKNQLAEAVGRELTWEEVERVQGYYAAWTEERLILDAVHPMQDNLEKALAYVRDVEAT